MKKLIAGLILAAIAGAAVMVAPIYDKANEEICAVYYSPVNESESRLAYRVIALGAYEYNNLNTVEQFVFDLSRMVAHARIKDMNRYERQWHCMKYFD